MPLCSTMSASGTFAPTTQPSRRFRPCAPITLFPQPTWTAISQRPHQAGAAVAARNRRRAVVRRGQPKLDQSALHLYARLRRGHVRGQQNYARWPARSADRKCPAGDQSCLDSSSPGRKSITAKRRKIRSSFIPRAKNSITRPATRTNIRPTREQEAFPSVLFVENRRGDLPGRAQHHFHQLSHRRRAA